MAPAPMRSNGCIGLWCAMMLVAVSAVGDDLPEAHRRLTQTPCSASLADLRATGERDRAAKSDTGAIERFLRWRVRRAHHGAGAGVKTARTSYFRGIAGALADVAELR